MKKKESKRDYHFSDADLQQLCDEKIAFATRDLTDLSVFGITPAMLTAIGTQNTSFKDLPTDLELLGKVSEATEAKDAMLTQVKTNVRSIMVRAESKYGVSTARYRRFGAEGLDKLSNAELLACGRRVSRVATELLPDLSTEGLTAAMLTNLTTLCNNFDSSLDKLYKAISDRDIATEDRINKGNVIYKDLVKLCSKGKQVWSAANEAKYNDFVIYNTPSGTPEPVNQPVM